MSKSRITPTQTHLQSTTLAPNPFEPPEITPWQPEEEEPQPVAKQFEYKTCAWPAAPAPQFESDCVKAFISFKTGKPYASLCFGDGSPAPKGFLFYFDQKLTEPQKMKVYMSIKEWTEASQKMKRFFPT